jgi:hypothetical protein
MAASASRYAVFLHYTKHQVVFARHGAPCYLARTWRLWAPQEQNLAFLGNPSEEATDTICVIQCASVSEYNLRLP